MMHYKHTTANGKYWISTNNTFDRGWETMVFAIKDGKVNYADLDCDRYISEMDAAIGHTAMIQKWEAEN
jgi:hypothetical protein